VPLTALVAVAGRRWTIEESFQGGKGLAGLDEQQVRRWTPWRRWTLLAMLAHALLVVLAAGEHATGSPPSGLIPLTCNELQRLLLRLVIEPSHRSADPQAWSSGGDDTNTAPASVTTTAKWQDLHDQRIYGWSITTSCMVSRGP
jgi:hypothetical protein